MQCQLSSHAFLPGLPALQNIPFHESTMNKDRFKYGNSDGAWIHLTHSMLLRSSLHMLLLLNPCIIHSFIQQILMKTNAPDSPAGDKP